MTTEKIFYTVKMLKTVPGVNDGEVYPVQFKEGEVYEIGEDLFSTFKNMGCIQLAKPGEKPKASEEEGQGEIPEDLAALTKADLLKLAGELGLEAAASMNKGELIEIIQAIKDSEEEGEE